MSSKFSSGIFFNGIFFGRPQKPLFSLKQTTKSCQNDSNSDFLSLQVKISANLGDDIQYLVLVASAATKVKIPAGPARLHIQNHRFCITTGVPPRLSGMWNIAHLRFALISELIKIHRKPKLC